MGTIHVGEHEDVMAAAQIANQAASDRASRKGTCWKAVKLDQCYKLDDARWHCEAVSANHLGSCNKSLSEVDDFAPNEDEGEHVLATAESD